jgi:hypothetical protein
MHIAFWGESQEERDQYEEQDVGGRTILEWILKVQDEVVLK